MSCTTAYCGTGGNIIPLPGDPSNNSVLTAKPAFGGIDLNWTFPTINPFAVAYTTIYRATSSDFLGAILLVPQAGGGFYYDPVEPGIEYFYWITFVSVNGTVGDLIGPVSAVARSSIDKTIQELTGKIDAGVLAQSLKTEIARISENATNLLTETDARLQAQWGLSLQILGQQEITDETVTQVFRETQERKDADSAMVNSINLLYAQAGGNAAAIIDEARVRADADNALAERINTTLVRVGDNQAAIIEETRVRANADSAMSERIDNLSAEVGEGTIAAIQEEARVRAEQDNVLAQRITTTETNLNGNIAQAQTTLQTNINTVNGRVTSIGALYTAKVTVNGLIGGFGIYNDGTEVQAGFDVDTFWVGRTNADKKKPFIISNGEVFIDQAVINQLVFTKLRDESGSVIVENGRLKAQYIDADNIVAKQIDVRSGVAGQPTSRQVNGLFTAYYANGQMAVRMGVWT